MSFAESLFQLREVFFIQKKADPNGPIFDPWFPAMAITPNFHRLSRDPRPIGSELSRVALDDDPRSIARSWRQILHNYLGGRVMQQTEYRFLLTYTPDRVSYSYRDAYKRSEENYESFIQRYVYDVKPTRGDDINCAVGFWLFPIHAFGSTLSDDLNTELEPREGNIYNLEEYWPELGLLDLS
ncbi:hypothetical protein F4781DRAFT_214618 [Annulohypoxylon bovei var. microspora]|nr:hypothetical protein F4781DRAFT_214618 [Annulohypoxylon bovei var. microspora]